MAANNNNVRRKVFLLGFLSIFFILAFILYAVRSLPHTTTDGERASVARLLRRSRRAAEEDCLKVLIARREARTLTSPNYPHPYPNDVNCQWLITTLQENETLAIRINTLAIEPEHECRLDSLRVHLGPSAQSPLVGGRPLCGRIEDRLIRTNSSVLLLSFRSDSSYEDAGFSIQYFVQSDDQQEEDNKGECPLEVLSGDSGWLSSPRFPANYPDGTECWTLVTVSPDKRVVLLFDTLDLEYGDNCTFDYVRIHDGDSKNSTVLCQICQESDVRRFESSSNSMLVHFHSDDSVNRRGFRARYSSVDRRHRPPVGDCVWESDAMNGTVTSPRYPENYPSLANCSLWIVAPPTHRILVHFDSLLLEMESNCSYDFLQIAEPSSTGDGGIPSRFCGRLSEPRQLTSNGNELQIVFHSDNFVEFLGFKLRYEFFRAEAESRANKDVGQEEQDEEAEFGFVSRPRNATLTPGSSHMLPCSTDHPNAKIRWLKGELFLAGDQPLPGLKVLPNGTLWIQSMESHLGGTYSCVAVAPEGTITTSANVLFVGESSCKIGFRKTPRDSELEEGSFALLECLATAPDLAMSWKKDGGPLPPHVTVLKNGYAFVDGVTLEDAGTYACEARDPASGCSKEASAQLQVSRRTRIGDVCGKPKFGDEPKKSHGKIIGGHNAKKGAYPWQVMLWDPKVKSFCGGILLNERWIATAAHCFGKEHDIPRRTIRIRLGKHDRELDEPQEAENWIADSANAVVIHPLYEPHTYDNDLALVRMRHRISFTDHILPVCLGDRELSEGLLSGSRMGTVIGWGELKEKGPSPRFLQEIKVPVVDQEVCRNSTRMRVTHNMFCAGYAQDVIGDACHGDSGGPFLVRNDEGDGRWYAVGIVSWGEGCGKKEKYGFYTKIANHIAWIRGVIES